jgi:outer membrane protein OmpA-like peptidoglycan-associated protein
MKPSPLAALVVLTAALAGCVSLQPVEGRVLPTRYEQRFTDEAIRRDWAAMEALRSRIETARAAGPAGYALWRAELMLEFGQHEYEENDRTGIADAALDDARLAVAAAERGGGRAALPPPSLPAVLRRREDLWSRLEEVRSDATVAGCAGEAVARLESGLVQLGHNQWEVEARMNTPEHVLPCPFTPLVDDLARELGETVLRCRQAVPPAVVAAEVPPSPVVDRFVLSAEALFRFDRCRAGDMLQKGREELDALGEALAGDLSAWSRIVVTGHTDRLGRRDYNLPLSRCRAETVRGYLVERFGLPADRLEARGVGSMHPVAFCRGPLGDALKACLQPNRRVELEVQR